VLVRTVYYFRSSVVARGTGDIDNLDKAMFDSLVQAKILADDKWIVSSFSRKVKDEFDWFTCEILEDNGV